MRADLKEVSAVVREIRAQLQAPLSEAEREGLIRKVNSLEALLLRLLHDNSVQQHGVRDEAPVTWAGICAPALPPPRSVNDLNGASNVVRLEDYRPRPKEC